MKQVLLDARAAAAAFFRKLWEATRRHPIMATVIALAAVPVVAIIYVLALIPFTPGIDHIKKVQSEQPTVVMSADGKELATFKRINREWVKLADISPNVTAALLATEDHRFFEHHGLDLQRTVSAVWRTLRGDTQGGSTLTQQLARNLFPEEIGRAQTITRKVKEAITAVKLESVYEKNEILETYLNTVPFLYNAYGIEVAARTYFDKPASNLDVLESATLIGMLKGTSYYNPVINPERSVARRNTVLAQLVKHDKLKQAEFEELKKRPLALEFERQEEDLGAAPHLSQQLRRWLISWADRRGYNIYADGLVVRTTVDSRLQKMATEALTRQADKLQLNANAAWGKRMGANKELTLAFVRETPQYRELLATGATDADAVKRIQSDAGFMKALWESKTQLQAAFLAMEPSTGNVRAWVGSRDFKQDQFDHVQQARRQPGSTFKPFVYGAAFEQGISPQETFVDEAVEFRLDAKTVWKPGDVHDSTGLPTTLRDGLVMSKNTITAQLMQRVGAPRVARVAYEMGVRESKLDPVPSLALGTSPVTLKEMVTAYGTIANNGMYVEPFLVLRVENRNHKVLEEFHPKGAQPGLATGAAQTLLDVMRGVIDKGTGVGIRSRFGIQGDLAGKTGTTQDNTDGWFILMHPNLVSGAWVGFNDNRITMGDSWGQGAHNALNIVGDFFQQSLKAKVMDAKATFSAPKEQGALDKMNDWLNSVFQAPLPDPGPQPVIVVEPQPPVPVLPSQSTAVNVPSAPNLETSATLPPRMPEYRVPEYRSPEYRAPEYRAPEYRAPEVRAPEYRAPEYRVPEYRASEPPPQSGGVVILRQLPAGPGPAPVIQDPATQ